jgi:hypothetical protein
MFHKAWWYSASCLQEQAVQAVQSEVVADLARQIRCPAGHGV